VVEGTLRTVVPRSTYRSSSTDAGRPVVATDPDGPEAQAFRAIAAKLLAALPQLRA